MAVSELKGTTIGGPLKVIRELQDSTREVLSIPVTFFTTDVAINQTDTPFDHGVIGVAEANMQFGGWVLGMSSVSSANFTAAAPVLTLTKNGTATTMTLTPALATTLAQTTEVDDYADAIRFERGDRLSIEFTTGAGVLPAGSVDMTVNLWIG